MMATNVVIVKDLFEEFSEENQRLFDELRYCQQLIELFDKFRQLLDNYQKNCCCIENNELKSQFSELVDQYMTLKSMTISTTTTTTTSADLIVDNKTYDRKDNNNNKINYNKKNKIITEDNDNDVNNNNNYNYLTKTVDSSADTLLNEPIKRSRGRPKKLMTLSSSATTDSQIIAINYRRSYNCDYTGCGKQFRFICLLKKHIQMDHKEERPFKCDVDGCDQRFYRKEHIKRHKTYVHCDDKPFGCEWPGCGLRFKDKARVRLHHRQHTGVDRKVPGISGKFTRKKWKKQPKEIREYKCHYIGCDKVYRHRPNQLAIHIRTKHTGERPFKCPECDKTYPFERNLKIHMKSVHPIDRKEYKCRYDGCNREFRFESTLKHHYLRHENLVERQFKCDVDGCDKSFYRKAHLNDHKAYLHSDERPLPCEWPGCDKRFKFIHELRNHRERHTGVLQYRCDIDGCNKAFTSKSGLFSHKKSHTKPYVCSWPACEARFECNVRLTDHTYEHQGLKPHKCHFQGCVCSYSSRVSLRHHLKLKHNYVKSICEKS